MSFPNSVSYRYSLFRLKGHRGKEKLATGHIGANEFFRRMEVKSTFHKDIQVKDSFVLPSVECTGGVDTLFCWLRPVSSVDLL